MLGSIIATVLALHECFPMTLIILLYVVNGSSISSITYVGALQITALGNPKLLERVAAGLMAIRNMFSQFDEDMNNVITREEFIKVTILVFITHPNL